MLMLPQQRVSPAQRGNATGWIYVIILGFRRTTKESRHAAVLLYCRVNREQWRLGEHSWHLCGCVKPTVDILAGGRGSENSFMIHRDTSEGPTLSMHKPHPCGRFKIVGDDFQKGLLMSRFSDPYQEDAGESLRRQGV